MLDRIINNLPNLSLKRVAQLIEEYFKVAAEENDINEINADLELINADSNMTMIKYIDAFEDLSEQQDFSYIAKIFLNKTDESKEEYLVGSILVEESWCIPKEEWKYWFMYQKFYGDYGYYNWKKVAVNREDIIANTGYAEMAMWIKKGYKVKIELSDKILDLWGKTQHITWK